MTQINTTVAIAASAGFAEAELLSFAWSSMGSELMLFAFAVAGYAALFLQRGPKPSKLQPKKVKVIEEDYKEKDYPSDAKAETEQPEQPAAVEEALQVAYEAGDYRTVLRCWNAMKKFESMPTVSLPHVVESMQRFKKDMPFVLRELKGFLKKFPSEGDMTCINDLLEPLGKRMDSDLMEKIVEMLPSLNLQMDARTYEIFLNMYFTTRSFQEVKTLSAQMKAKQVSFNSRSAMVVVKTALKMNDLDEALLCFRELKNVGTSTVSSAPAQIISLLVELACKDHRLGELLVELTGMIISEEVLNSMLLECVRQKDAALTQKVEKFAREQGVRFTDTTYSLLIRGVVSEPARVQALFDEVVQKGLEMTPEFVNSVLSCCAQTSNVTLADRLYSHMKPTQLPILSTFIRFYAENEQYEKACDIYEHDTLRAHDSLSLTVQLDARMERSLMNAALKCGRPQLAQSLLSSSPSDIAKHITMIRNCGSEGNLKGAVSVFHSLEQSGVDLNSIIYNTVLDACVECRDLQAAEAWMESTKKAGMADVVSFNTLIKAHLQNKNFAKARSLMEEIKTAGLQPNRVTFNELINALVIKGGDSRRGEMWDIVEEMTSAGVKPNQVTISILLKNLNSYSGQKDIEKTMDLINTMEEPMDEVLLSSVVEACVRIGKPELLESKLKQLEGKSAVAISGSHTYGSLIKAHGHARDLEAVWRCWGEMRSRHIKPTSITLGCMVEAVVCNGDTEGAYELIHQMRDDESCRKSLNSVIYCSVLKGFCREKKFERVWQVYEEINEIPNIELSVVTCNTVIDACARCGRMESLPRILEDMKKSRVKPNIITYSTMLKGHCQNGDIQTGFLILEQMKKDAHLKPDEIMYNSLLDGCAQNNMIEEGLSLLEEMQTAGVPPSNFTLSLLVKLMNRARKLDQAFALVESITKKYNFRPNVHVYTNLIQACVSNQSLTRAMSLLEQMLRDRVAPESRTYAILMRASMTKGLFQQVVGLMKGALGIEQTLSALSYLQTPGAVCWNLDHALVNEVLAGLAERGQAKDLAIPLLSSIRQAAPKVRIDAATQRKIMNPCITSDAGYQRPTKGKGKGKGSW